MPYRVFISHSRCDMWIARQIDRCLREIEGVETFLDDKDVHGGDSIRDAILVGLQSCDEFVVIYSGASSESDWVKIEVGAAWALGKRVIFLLEKQPQNSLPPSFRDLRNFDLNEIDLYFQEVKSRLRRLEAS